MSSERHERLTALFLEACDLPRAEQERFIDSSCGDSPSLAHELRQMLDAQQSTPSGVLTGGFADLLPDGPPPLPETIGPYSVIELLGEGGMGIVYRARQHQPIERDVAIKLVRLGVDSGPQLRRFDAERQTLARLNHPNIATVFDAGKTEHGRSFFVMEYVQGRPITHYCRENNLPLNQRLQIFIDVCRAVQHAHNNAIIHRDLKPSNILVAVRDGEPTAKVIDFGIAKALDASDRGDATMTQLGSVLGTPSYMSPEQTDASIEAVDTRSDVYSLGATLFELLTGQPPHGDSSGRSLFEIQREIREEEPTLPSKLTGERNLRGELDTIVMKALRKSRRERYQSPADLADDLERYLAGLPIHAVRPTLAYRIAKKVRRHPAVSGVLGVALLTALIAGTVILVQRSQLNREQLRAEQEAEVSDALSTYLASLFDISEAVGHRSTTGLQVDTFLVRGAHNIDLLEEHPTLQWTVLQQFGSLRSALGDPAAGLSMLHEAERRAATLFGENAPESLHAKYRLGIAYANGGDFDRATSYFSSLSENTQEGRISELEAFPYLVEYGLTLKLLARLQEAETVLAGALQIARRETPESTTRWVAEGIYGAVLLDLGELERSRQQIEGTLDGMREALGAKHIESVAAQYNLAVIATQEGDFDQALRQLSSIAAYSPLNYRRDPAMRPLIEAVPETELPGAPIESTSEYNLAKLQFVRLWSHSRLEDALGVARRLLAYARIHFGDAHTESRDAAIDMAWTLIRLGRCDEVGANLDAVREALIASNGDDSDAAGSFLWIDAHCAVARGDRAVAQRLIRQAHARLVRDIPHQPMYHDPEDAFVSSDFHALHGDLSAALAAAEQTRLWPWYSLLDNLAFQDHWDDPRLLAWVEEHEGRE